MVKRTADCSKADARVRLQRSRKFLEIADLVAEPDEAGSDYANVAASLAVLAGIAASDAATCHALGTRSRSDDHRDASDLLKRVMPGGDEAAKDLVKLLDVKHKAQYGVGTVGMSELKAVLRRAHTVVEFAEDRLRS